MTKLSKYPTLLMIIGFILASLLVQFGHTNGQIEDTRAWSSVLCVSCIGVDLSQPHPAHHDLHLDNTDNGENIFSGLKGPVEVLYFTATWCPYCPAVKEYLDEVEEASGGLITYQTIDYDENRDIAIEYQITGIPAVIIDGYLRMFGLIEVQNQLIPGVIEYSEVLY